MAVHTPSAADLDAEFTMANGNGRLCEAILEHEERHCGRDATYLVRFAFHEEHPCRVMHEAAMCLDHALHMTETHKEGTARCGYCWTPALGVTVTPLGGR